MNVMLEIGNSSQHSWVPASRDCERWIKEALHSAGRREDCTVSLQFVDASESARLNGSYRGKHTATNVLAFPLQQFAESIQQPPSLPELPIGDIVICPQIVDHEAAQQSKTREAHWAHMLIHGTLHLLGFLHDDSAEAEAMEQVEIAALKNLGFPNPYLIG